MSRLTEFNERICVHTKYVQIPLPHTTQGRLVLGFRVRTVRNRYSSLHVHHQTATLSHNLITFLLAEIVITYVVQICV